MELRPGYYSPVKKIKIVFLGATGFSRELLLHLLDHKLKIERLYPIPQEFKISDSDSKVKNYNFANLSEIAAQHSIPFYKVESTTGKELLIITMTLLLCSRMSFLL